MIGKIAFVVLFSIIGIAIISRRWRLAVFSVMILVIFEGALRKWIMPGSQAILYFLKDIILLGAYIGFWSAGARFMRSPEERRLGVLCSVFSAYCLVEILNPLSPSIILGAVGWKAYCWYMPLAFLVPYLFRSPQEMNSLMRRYLYLALPISLFGIIQFFTPYDSPLNMNVAHDEGGSPATLFGGGIVRVRATGTFSYITGYAEYLMTIAFLGIMQLGHERWRLRGNIITYSTLICTVGALFSTGSRGALFVVLLGSGVYLFLSALHGNISARVALRATLGIIGVGILTEMMFQDVFAAILARTRGDEDMLQRIINPFLAPFHAFDVSPALGFGTGTTHNAAQSLLGTTRSWWLGDIAVEGETGRVMVELGLPGFLLFYFLRVYVLIIAFRYSRKLRTRTYKMFASGLLVFSAAHLIGGIVVNPTAAVLFWFAVGLLFALKRFDSMPKVDESRNVAKNRGLKNASES